MTKILINYDLVNPGQDYDAVIDTIQGLGSWARVLMSTWAVDTSFSPAQVRDALNAVTDKNDKFYVVDIQGKASAWYDLPDPVAEWLRSH